MNIQNSLCRGGGNCVWLEAVLLVSPMGKYRITPVGDKEFCFAFGGFIGFTNGEYHVVHVDFIAPCGGTKGQRRRTLRIPPSLSGTTLAWFRIEKAGSAESAVSVLWCPRKEQ